MPTPARGIFELQDFEVAAGITVKGLPVMHHQDVFIAAKDGAGTRHQHFVHPAAPPETLVVADAALPPELAGGVAILVLTRAVLPIKAIDVRGRCIDRRTDASWVVNHVVRVQPTHPVPGPTVLGTLP